MVIMIQGTRAEVSLAAVWCGGWLRRMPRLRDLPKAVRKARARWGKEESRFSGHP